ncbi:hypothetical protein TNCV_2739711 [Trichonephila clavipes]|nr:hypothetical protein TNCV_2739711 [Trichonephila clavipes]
MEAFPFSPPKDTLRWGYRLPPVELVSERTFIHSTSSPADKEGEASHVSSPITKLVDLWLDGYLEYSHAAYALYHHEHPCLLRDSNVGPMAQQSASLTIIPDGWLFFQFLYY